MNKQVKIDNLHIWNSVCETNPVLTKKVNQRGGFTAIDAYGQIEAATKQFGPVGQGWGWEIVNTHFLTNNTVVIEIQLWHGLRDNWVHVVGQKKLGTSDRPDEDAFKKALTDAITKGLSYLGFNADVFLGKFDDNKYIKEMDEKFNSTWHGPIKVTALKEHLRGVCDLFGEITEKDTIDHVNGIWADSKDELNQAKVDLPDFYQSAIDAARIAKKKVNQ